MIYSNSRYNGAKITEVHLEDGSVRPFVHDRITLNRSDAKSPLQSLALQANMELDFIASRFYKSSIKYWILADINEILFPLFDEDKTGDNDMKVGKILFIPLNA